MKVADFGVAGQVTQDASHGTITATPVPTATARPSPTRRPPPTRPPRTVPAPPPAPVARAMLTVVSKPPDRPVRIDGAERGRTPLTIDLPPGAYEVSVQVSPNLPWKSRTVTLPTRSKGQVELELVP